MLVIATRAHADQERLAADAAAMERLSGSLRLDRLSWHVAERRFEQAATPEEREAVARDLVRVIEPMAEAADPELADALAQRLERILDQFVTVHVDAPGMACVGRLLDASSHVIGQLRAGDPLPAAEVAQAIGWASRAESLADAMLKDLGSRTPPGFEQLLRSRLAWSRLQGAWLRSQGEGRGVEDLAESAIRPLAEVLEIDPRTPKPEEVSVDLRSSELYAWAIVGMAQARALMPRGGASDAMRWLELCDDPVTAPAVRTAAMEWRLQVCLDAHDWTRARVLLTSAGPVPQGFEPAIARVARRAARLGASDPDALRVVEAALPMLLASGRGDLVSWVAQALPPSGASGVVQALGALATASTDRSATPDALRSAADGALGVAAKTKGSAASALKLEAARLLLRAGDASQAAAIAGECLAQSSEPAPAVQWLRFQALAAAQDSALGAELLAFLAGPPSGEWTTRAAILAASRGIDDDAVLLALEAVDESDPSWRRAQDALCTAAYDRMRGAAPTDRVRLAELVLRPVPAPSSAWPDGRIDPVVLRQLVTAMLPWVRSPASIARAGALLDEIASSRPQASLDPAERAVVAEATVRVACARGFPEQALVALGALEGPQQAKAARDVLDASWEVIRDGAIEPSRRDRVAIDAATAAQDQIDPSANPALSLTWIRVATVAVSAGEAMLAPRLMSVATALADRSPDRDTLLAALAAARAAHDDPRSVSWGTRLASGLSSDDPERSAVEVMLIDSLSRVDPDRARTVLRQCFTLMPGWRQGPQAEPLAELARRLGVDG
ncbi:MAG: hypothetical protein FJ254_04510 [Phycisphaerae bacterium]|nr:hypothetical protein [Phycisphaerae bacterium]